MDYSKIYNQVHSSVVKIIAQDTLGQILSVGTGVVIENGLFIITCEHCVNNAHTITAEFSNNSVVRVTLEKTDTINDLALLKILSPTSSYVANFQKTTPLIGQVAFVIGYPMNVSSKTFLSAHIAGFEKNNHIRIDAPINHGNSGGALFNVDGEIIGIVYAKLGNISNFLKNMQNLKTGAKISIGGFDPVAVVQQLIKEMTKNLNLGIGIAIPSRVVLNFLESYKLKC